MPSSECSIIHSERHRRALAISTNFASCLATVNSTSVASVPPAVLALTRTMDRCSMRRRRRVTTGTVAACAWNTDASRWDRCVTRINIVSRLRWQMWERSAASNGRNGSTSPHVGTAALGSASERSSRPLRTENRELFSWIIDVVNTASTLDQKAERLREILAGRASLLVAYSGGVDSAFLAWMAHQVLGAQMRAIIADSASLARTHLEDALAFAREREIPVEVVETQELENPAYTRNDAMRC